jgi:hypothetical protein
MPTIAKKKVIVDEASPTVTYIGEGAPGASTALPVWQITRLTTTTVGTSTITETEHANGSSEPINIWDNRASLNYL